MTGHFAAARARHAIVDLEARAADIMAALEQRRAIQEIVDGEVRAHLSSVAASSDQAANDDPPIGEGPRLLTLRREYQQLVHPDVSPLSQSDPSIAALSAKLNEAVGQRDAVAGTEVLRRLSHALEGRDGVEDVVTRMFVLEDLVDILEFRLRRAIADIPDALMHAHETLGDEGVRALVREMLQSTDT